MMYLKSILSIVLVAVASSLAVAAPGEPTGTVREYFVNPQWSSLPSTEARYYLEPHYLQRGELLGAFVEENGSVYICDKVTEQLIKLDPEGEEVFAVGSLGAGPEDHQMYGELLLWRGGLIARSDASMPSKIILYEMDGDFFGDINLNVHDSLGRLFWNGKYVVGSFTSAKYLPTGAEMATSLRMLKADGTEIKKIPLDQIILDRKHKPTREETWISPYLAVSDDGFCFVQEDLYGGRVDCYDQDLNMTWSIDGGWEPLLFTPEEILEAEHSVLSESMHQTIRRMFARRDGEVWIQPWTSDQTSEYVEFESFGRKGTRLGFVHIFGLPKGNGSWALHGSKVLWMAEEKANAENESVTISYIRVFDLVSK